MNSQETEVTAHKDRAAFRRDYPIAWLLIGRIAVIATVVIVLIHRYLQLTAQPTACHETDNIGKRAL